MRENLNKKTASRMKRNYDICINQNNYNVGDLVYCLDKTKAIGQCKKIDPQIWKGPFVVERKFTDLFFFF